MTTVGSVDTIKALRERTGAGMMDCKAALRDAGNDIEKAIDVLRKKGMAQAAKRAGREAKEGLVAARVNGAKAAMVEANCETDFVARTDDFKGLVAMALEEAFAAAGPAIHSDKLNRRIAELSGKIGEKILLKRVKVIQSEKGVLFVYVHSNNKLGVVVELAAAKAESMKHASFGELGKNLAMQVAASNPMCISRAQVPSPALEREKAIFREEVKGKPEKLVEKIIQGKVNKFYRANCLLEQVFIRDDKMTVQALLDRAAKPLGDTLEVKQFVRFQLGETVSA
ncbi:MAG: elongation factor Ts [Candidatus Omnitrophica bacterium CG07_land_8_20_14_0_80_50_8]|nr:MAG: elongation factor Ts [Candidatus Omnitrophica bacterium CG07_land_8_20_14_0_80_50_8]